MFEIPKEVEDYREKVRDYVQKVVKDYAKYMDETNEGNGITRNENTIQIRWTWFR